MAAAVGGWYLLSSDEREAAQYARPVPAVIGGDTGGQGPAPAPAARDRAAGDQTAPDRPAPDQRPETWAPQQVATRPLTPDQIVIPASNVNTVVTPASAVLQPAGSSGQPVLSFPVPDSAWTTVWWQDGPAPGADGLAVILGHAQGQRSTAFGAVADLREGAVIGIMGASEGEHVVADYRVLTVVTGVAKADANALRAVLDDAPEGAALALITCSGEIDEALGSHRDNTVVFATLSGMYDDETR
ncbi:MAG: sortase [Actinomycetia bacterium]|nr:sortase [Actinomycetes bacterium]